MENEKNCQQELAETEEVVETTAEETVEETVVAEEPVEDVAEETVEETPAAPEKKATPGKIALAVGAIVVLAAALIALVANGFGGKSETAVDSVPAEAVVEETVVATVPADGNPEDVTCKGTYTVTDEEAKRNRETVVATIGNQSLTNGQLQTYYWSIVNSYLSSEYGYYMMMYGVLDYAQPLDTQICMENENLTWQQYFLDEALNYWQLCTSLSEEAKANGVEMSAADREYLDNLYTSLEATAESYGMTLDELMLNNIGPGAGLEEFVYFQELYCQGKDFYENALTSLEPSQEELEAFFAEHEEDYAAAGVTKDSKYVNARHILVIPEGGGVDENGATVYTDEEWAACKEKAQAILDEFLAGDHKEETFAAMATEKTQDGGSQGTGGLYENIYEGQMVKPFEDWCFDDSRQYGDTGLVQTDYGYHVMYYVSSTPAWLTYAENDYITEKSNAFLADLSAKYPLNVEYDKISLGFIDLGSK